MGINCAWVLCQVIRLIWRSHYLWMRCKREKKSWNTMDQITTKHPQLHVSDHSELSELSALLTVFVMFKCLSWETCFALFSSTLGSKLCSWIRHHIFYHSILPVHFEVYYWFQMQKIWKLTIRKISHLWCWSHRRFRPFNEASDMDRWLTIFHLPARCEGGEGEMH